MNRAERRRLKREEEKSGATYNIKSSDISAIKRRATGEAVDKAFTMMLVLPLMVLRDKYGFGKKRLSEFIEYTLENYDSFEKGYVTLEDLQDTLKEETGITLEINVLNKYIV